MVTNCDNCGVCCMRQNLLPYTAHKAEGTFHKLPSYHREYLTVIAIRPLVGDDGCPCIWLSRLTGRCDEYEHRPQKCRDFGVGSEACETRREEYKVRTPETETAGVTG